MIAIFNTVQDAKDYSDKIHPHLTQNRPGYNAERCSDVNKSDANEFAVKIPTDLPKLKVAMKAVDLEKSVRTITKYPIDWKTIEEIDIKKL